MKQKESKFFVRKIQKLKKNKRLASWNYHLQYRSTKLFQHTVFLDMHRYNEHFRIRLNIFDTVFSRNAKLIVPVEKWVVMRNYRDERHRMWTLFILILFWAWVIDNVICSNNIIWFLERKWTISKPYPLLPYSLNNKWDSEGAQVRSGPKN